MLYIYHYIYLSIDFNNDKLFAEISRIFLRQSKCLEQIEKETFYQKEQGQRLQKPAEVF